MQRSFKPSCFKVNESAANRVSFSINRRTKLRRTVLETIKEKNDPTTVAVANMSHLNYNEVH